MASLATLGGRQAGAIDSQIASPNLMTQPEDRVNPSGVRYSQGAIPLATPAKSAIRKFYPSNGRDFSPESVKVIQLPLAAEGMFLDASGHSFLKFDITDKAGGNTGTYAMGGGGAHGWIKRLRLLSATGQQLEDIDDYNALHSLMIDMQCSPNYCDTVLRARQGFGRQTLGGNVSLAVGSNKKLLCAAAAFDTAPDRQGTVTIVADSDAVVGVGTDFTSADVGKMIVVAGERRLVAAVADQLNLTVNREFQSSDAAQTYKVVEMTGRDEFSTAGSDQNDVSLTATLDGVSLTGSRIKPTVTKTFTLNLMSGLLSQPKYLPLLATKGGIQIELTLEDPTVFLTHAGVNADDVITDYDPATMGSDSYQIKNVEYVAELIDFGPDFNERFRQMLMQTGGVLLSGSTYRNHTSQIVANAQVHNVSISERSRSIKSIFTILRQKELYQSKKYESISDRTRANVEEYQYRVGSLVYPDHKVKIGKTNAAEAVAQAYKALGGALTDVHHGSLLTETSFVRGQGTGVDGAGQPVTDAQMPIEKIITSVEDRGKCVFGMTFESTTQDSSMLESGLNSAAQALPIEFRAEGSRNITTRAGVNSDSRCNSYVLVDAIFSFLPNGEVAASV